MKIVNLFGKLGIIQVAIISLGPKMKRVDVLCFDIEVLFGLRPRRDTSGHAKHPGHMAID